MAVKAKMDRKKTHGAAGVSRRSPRRPWPILAVNFILMALILGSGFMYTRRQISLIKRDKKNELQTITELKTSQIRHWLDAILAEGRFLRSTMNDNARFIKKLKIKPADFNSSVSAWLKAFKDFKPFAEIYFLDTQSRSVWLIAEQAEPANPALARELQTDFDASEVSISDLYFSKTLKRITLNLRVPIGTVSAVGNGPQAMLLLSIDPGQSLFPLIQSWSTASPSAEILLVRREGNEVVYLNDLRHRKNTALRLRYPIAKNETAAARAARGEVGFVTGPDYRGIPVLADIHRIPGTSWSLIAKIDQEEVRLLVTRQEWVMFALVLSVFLLLFFISANFWRQQQVDFLRRQVTNDAALQESETRYRLLIENQGEGIGLVDAADRFVFANPAAGELFGMEPGNMAGRSLQEFVSAADFEKIRNKTTARSDIGKESYELKIIRPDGSQRILQVTVTPRFDENGQFSGTFGIFRDITERKHNEDELSRAFDRLSYEKKLTETIVNSMPGIFYTLDLTGRFARWNTNFERVIGYHGEEIDAINALDLFAGEDRQRISATIQKVAETGEAMVEAKILHKAGHGTPYLFTGLRIEIEGTPHLIGMGIDITERKQAEEKINKMLAEKELLLQEVHHRVKNNMMVIGSLLQIQAQRLDDPKISTVLQESQNRIHAMMAIYEKLYRATDLTHIGLDDYFSELASSLFAAYNIRPGTIELETAIDDIELDIDQTIPCGLIINELVSNTLKYAFTGERPGRIRIEFCKMDSDCRGAKFCAQAEELHTPPMYALTVANDGVPLPPGFDSSKSSGFGLQLVTMLAGQLGGKLEAHSREWTEFRIVFPMNQAKTGGATA